MKTLIQNITTNWKTNLFTTVLICYFMYWLSMLAKYSWIVITN